MKTIARDSLVIDPTVVGPKAALWTGRVMSGLAIAFLLFDCACKIFQVPMAVETSVGLGYPASTVLPIGVVELACLVAYAIPRTSVVGALLMTGYLGGAIATHLRVGSPLASHTLFPIYVAILVWGGLWLRRADLRALLLGRPAR